MGIRKGSISLSIKTITLYITHPEEEHTYLLTFFFNWGEGSGYDIQYQYKNILLILRTKS